MRTFILGTDWGSDCDDVVAVRILARAARDGKIRLAGAVINNPMEYAAASLDGFLQTEGLTDVPIGIDKEPRDFASRVTYQKRLAQYAVHYKTNEDAEDGVRLYRRLLHEAKEKVEIVEIGFLHVIAAALTSAPDDISPLTGEELFRTKVQKIWAMAGKWDEDCGREYNLCANPVAREGGRAFCETCPVPVTFLGFEIGADVVSGSKLSHADVLYDALCDHGSPNGRLSWDPMLVSLALAGDEERAGYDVVRGTAHVDAETGANRFVPSDDGLHAYVIRKHDAAHYAEILDGEICSF